MAIAGGRIAVSAPRADEDRGVIDVFTHDGTAWTAQQELTNPGGTSGQGFGKCMDYKVGPDLGCLVAGAPGHSSQTGRAWAWMGGPDGVLDVTSPVALDHANGASFDEAGASVAVFLTDKWVNPLTGFVVEGHALALVGAPGMGGHQGELHAFAIDSAGMTTRAGISPGSSSASRFGHSIAITKSSLSSWPENVVSLTCPAPGHGGVETNAIEVFEYIDTFAAGDCDGDGLWDFLQLGGGQGDCDGDGIYDACQVMMDPTADCDGDGTPDACQADLDGDGQIDPCDDDIDGDGYANDVDAFPTDASEWADTDGDGVGDNTDPDIDGDGWDNTTDAFPFDGTEWADADGDGIGDNADPDDDNDGITDECDADHTSGDDCDVNGILDACEVDSVTDCNLDGILDACQLGSDTDCDANGILDECQGDTGEDCDMNGEPDVCQLSPLTDCNANGTLDVCESGFVDCDANGLIDLCEIAADPALDCDRDGHLDSCVTPGQSLPIWSTEAFRNDVDLEGYGVHLSNQDSEGVYTTCTTQPEGGWLSSPLSGTDLSLTDDASVQVPLNASFTFFGREYSSVHVCSNGYLVFGNTPDTSFVPSIDTHFKLPRISGVFSDLDPSTGGDVRYHYDASLQADIFSWFNVAHYRDDVNDPLRYSSCQIALYADQSIGIAWPTVSAMHAVTGVSGGFGTPMGWVETDVTIATNCEQYLPDGHGDCDYDRYWDNCEVAPPDDILFVAEMFIGDMDITGHVVSLRPDDDQPSGWEVCSDITAANVFVPPSDATDLLLGDDAFDVRTLPFAFDFADQSWTQCYVSSNGTLTFNQGDAGSVHSLQAHFSQPRISALFCDLDPSALGGVFEHIGPAGSYLITWYQVPTHGSATRLNTVQAQLHSDGGITLVYLDVAQPGAIVGVSETDQGLPATFANADLSAAFDCQLKPAFKDCNVNGTHDPIDLSLGCFNDADGNGVIDECDPLYAVNDPIPCVGDVDRSGTVDVRDLVTMLTCWSRAGEGCGHADLNGDQDVDTEDLVALIQALGTICH